LNDSWIKKGMPPLNGLVAPDEGSCGYGLGGMVLGPRFKHVTDSLCNSGGLYVWSGAASSHAFTDPVTYRLSWTDLLSLAGYPSS